MPPCFSDHSRQCLDVLPNTTMLACSMEAGWTSMLARHSRSAGACEVYDTHPTSDQSIVVVTKGGVDVESFEGGRWHRGVYRAGSAGMTAPGEVDRLRWRLRPGSDTFEKLHLFLPCAVMEEAAEHLRRPGQRAPSVSLTSLVFRDGALAHVAAALVTAIRSGAPDLYAQATAQWLAVHLLSTQAQSSNGDDHREPDPITDARLSRALDYMSASLSRSIDLDAIAGEAGVSKYHFVRLFRERTGETPMRYLVNLRLETAARMLATSDLPISRIAFESGHTNVTHFNGAFRRRYGVAPGVYRQKC